MRAGRLDRRITIEQKTTTKSAYGEPQEVWANFATVWAKKKDLRGQEFYAARQDIGEITTKFGIRYLEGIKMDMRINFGGNLYDIEQIIELGRRDGIEILAVARVD